ncbi:MAG: 1-deoxy-D-xylulose-5-phosphate reductoisomerase [Anaeroplasmataceae bacterium]|nr:1-deoxy-D-xylulose-5-phosphate reductoisomerase [Anaeroplasmataceae bacterium]MDE6414158.1 1-deoxy-D-xylulose-5-phosphate reductoisomerase [Anaeroplasmataceae bacterium]
MKYLYILGACGSIGTQTLDVVRQHQEEYKVVGMSVGSNLELAKKLIEEFKPEIVCFRKQEHIFSISYKPIVVYGDEGLLAISRYRGYRHEWLVNALVGVVGLLPTVTAIKARKSIALANKETLVVAGDIINELLKKYKVELVPIDSEHSAILQCLRGEEHKDIDKLLITASGGSFRNKTREELENVTVEDALRHPNWSMGPKITIDSATMMNKGFEVIEAHYLFDIDYEHIEAIYHPESIVHSLVQFKDGSIKAQLGVSDMRIPIAYALAYPTHLNGEVERLDLKGCSLHFGELSKDRYPCLGYAYEAAKKSGLYLAVLNASNEAAVYLFLNKKISFLEIEHIIEKEISSLVYERSYTPSLEERITVGKEVYLKILKEYGEII